MPTKTDQFSFILSSDGLEEIMKKSFEFWHKNYNNSPINYPLVWKKALESNSEIIERIEIWEKNSNKNIEIILEQFLEMWSYAIRKSNFEIAKKSIQDWENYWRNTTEKEFRVCSEVLQMIEKYWANIQNRNIE